MKKNHLEMFSFWTAQNAQYKNKELMEKGIPLNSPKSSIRVGWKLRCLICSPMTAMAYKFIIIKNHCPWPLVGYVMHIIYHLHDSGLLSISINFLTNENWGNFNELNLSCNILAHTYVLRLRLRLLWKWLQVQGYWYVLSMIWSVLAQQIGLLHWIA